MLNKLIHKIFPYLYTNPSFGRVKFWLYFYINCILSFFGYSNYSRKLEFPWVLKQLKNPTSLMEIGCVTSFFSHELENRVKKLPGIINFIGVDVRPYPYQPKSMLFFGRDIRDMGWYKTEIDTIVSVSTIEHIGLGYGGVKFKDGDLDAMKCIKEMLATNGKLLITVPYSGKYKILKPFTRIYDEDRIIELCKGFNVIEKEYFAYYENKWVKVTRKSMALFTKPEKGQFGIVCLYLTKE